MLIAILYRRKFQHKFFRQPLQCLTYMYDNALGSDVTLVVQGQGIPCHKVILAAHSSVLYDMFQHDPDLKTVDIEDVSHDVMATIARYCLRLTFM